MILIKNFVVNILLVIKILMIDNFINR